MKQNLRMPRIAYLVLGMFMMIGIDQARAQTFTHIKTFGSPGIGQGQFGDVGYIAIDSRQRIIVTDPFYKRVSVFDKDGGFISFVGEGTFNFIGGVAVDKDDNIYVSDQGLIKVFSSSGNLQRSFYAGYASSLAINKNTGVIYVTNGTYGRIEAYKIATGDHLHDIGGVGPMVVDESSNYLHYSVGTGIYQADASGFVWGGFSGLFSIAGVAMDAANNYYLTKNISTTYQVNAYEGGTISSMGTIGGSALGSADGQFSNPTFMVIDNVAGRLIVADRGNYRIQIFALPQSTISNFNNITKTFGDASFNLNATSTSSGTMTYREVPEGTGDIFISGNTVSILQAGTVKIRALAGKDATHVTTAKEITLTIQKANASVSLSDLTQVYNGSARQVTATTTPYGKAVTLEYRQGSTVVASPVEGGTYSVTATINDANYQGSATGTLTITKANQSITFGRLNAKTYGDTDFALTATSSSGLPVSYSSSNPEVATISGNIVSIVGGGSTTITASQAGNGNYSAAASVQQTLDIVKANQTLTFDPLNSQSYGNAPFQLNGISSSGLGIVYTSSNTSVATVSGSTLTIKGAGTATITATQPGDTRYNAATSISRTLTVSKAYQTITFTSVPVKTFGDAAFDLVASSDSGLPLSFSSSTSSVATISGKTVTITGAGSTTIRASQSGNGNYYSAVDVDVIFTVNKAAATLALSNLDYYYDGASKQATVTTTPAGLTGVSIAYKIGSSVIAPPSATGSYTVEATLANPNYAAPMVSGTLTISDKPVATINHFQSLSKVYGDPAFDLSATSNSSGAITYSKVAGGTGNVSLSGATVTILKAGTVTLRATVVGDDNFASASKDITLTIDKAPLTATVDNKSRVYGEPNPALTVSLSGFKNNETVAVIQALPNVIFVSPVTANSPAGGDYSMSIAGDVTSDNYRIGQWVDGKLTITKATLTITASNASRAYGSADPAFTFTATGFKNGETASVLSQQPLITSSATALSSTGTYELIASGAVATNYNLVYQRGTLTITKAPLTLTVSDQARTYGEAEPVLTYSLTGLKNNQNASVLDTPPVLSTSTTITSPAGNYTGAIIMSSAGSDNDYQITSSIPGNMMITKAGLKVIAENTTRAYGDANPALKLIYEGFRNNETSSVLTTLPTATTAVTPQSNVGVYDITPAGGSAANYYFIYQSGTMTVSKAMLTIRASDRTRNYGEANPAFGVTYSGFKNSDNASVFTASPIVATTATPSSNVGEYPLTVNGAAAANYTIAYIDGKLTVTKASLGVKADNKSRVYKSANPSFTLSYTGFKGNDDERVLDILPTGSSDASEGSDAGNYTINVSGGSDNNYQFVTYQPGVLTISKATQSIDFAPIRDKNMHEADFSVGATATSGLDVTYTISGPATLVNGNTIHLNSTEGTVTVKASQAGNINYEAAADVSQSFQVTPKLSQSITFSALPARYFNQGNFVLEATATSGLAVTYQSSNPDVATISGAQVTIRKAGNVRITASQPGNDQYIAAADVDRELVINKAGQTISFEFVPELTLAQSPVTLKGTSTSGLTVTYLSSNPAVAVADGAKLVLIGKGTTTITAMQPGDGNYLPASEVTQTLRVKDVQQITFNTLNAMTVGDAPLTLEATSTSELAMVYQSSNTSVAVVDGNKMTVVGAGVTVITASQPGNENYAAAVSVSRSLVVNKKTQTITFAALPDKIMGEAPFTLSAASSSGLAVLFSSSNPQVATISNNVVTLIGSGETLITARQAGSDMYNEATAVRKLLVKVITGDIGMVTLDEVAVYPNPAIDYVEVRQPSSVRVISASIADLKGLRLATATIDSHSELPFRMDIHDLAPGVYLLEMQTAKGRIIKRIVKK